MPTKKSISIFSDHRKGLALEITHLDEAALISILGKKLGWNVESISDRQVLQISSSSRVERLRFARRDLQTPPSVIVKLRLRQPGACEQFLAIEGEIHAALHEAGAPLPSAYWHGEIGEQPSATMLVLEDLTEWGTMASTERSWKQGQLQAIASAVAKFHAAGRIVKATHPYLWRLWLKPFPPANLSAWLYAVSQEVPSPPAYWPSIEVADLLARLADRYDGWMAYVAPWQTIVHHDILPCHVALCRSKLDGWEARLIDTCAASLGMPQLDLAWSRLSQQWRMKPRDWTTMMLQHFKSLRHIIPDLAPSEELWYWGYYLARLQILLMRQRQLLAIAGKGEQASVHERKWLKHGLHCAALFERILVHACECVFQEAPAQRKD